MHVDDAAAFIVDSLQNPRRVDGYPTYGYDVWLPNVIVTYIVEVEKSTEPRQSLHRGRRVDELSPFFYDAAWGLCRLGVLRPGIKDARGPGAPDGAGAEGYCLTAVGHSWLERGASAVFLADPDRLSQMFDKLSYRFGPGFLQRATEAVRCHRFGSYLGCCAMCGAAAESILLAVAIAKSGEARTTLATYQSASGRRRVVENVVRQVRPGIADPFKSATGLLSYWRDAAAHGLASTISEIEAHEALSRLLRFSQFTTENWEELTRPS
jgi:hypothetical protein